MALALLAARYVLAGVFLRSGLAKLSDLPDFRSAVANYQLVPLGAIPAVALGLPIAEVAVALLVAAGVLTGPAAAVMALFLMVFAGAIAINLARGRVFDCGCGGRATPLLISWVHVRLDAAMAVVAVAIALAPPVTLALWPGPRVFTV